MTKLWQKQDLVEDKEKKTSWSKVWAVCCLCLSTSLSRSMLKLRGNNQDAGKALSKKIEMFLSRKIQPACYRRRLWPARQVPRRFWDTTFVVWRVLKKSKILKNLLFYHKWRRNCNYLIQQPQVVSQLLSCSSPKTHEWYFSQPEENHASQHTKAGITFAYRSSVYGMICLESWSSYPSIDTSIVYVFTWLDIVCFQFLQHSHLVGQIGCHVTSHRPALLLRLEEIWK